MLSPRLAQHRELDDTTWRELMLHLATFIQPALLAFAIISPTTAPTGAGVRTPSPAAQPAAKIETAGGTKTQTRDTTAKRETRSASRTSATAARSAVSAVATASNYVGIIPGAGGCPPFTDNVFIHMDDEDNQNADHHSGWIGATVQNTNTTFSFCRVPGTNFKRTTVTYAVLKLDASCPSGSTTVTRHFDNEDNFNANSWYVTPNYTQLGIAPNISNSNTDLYFCMFPSMAVNNPFPSFNIEYGVFAASNLPGALATGSIYTDDEDHLNANSYGGGYNYQAAEFILGSNNTTINIAKVRDAPPCNYSFKINGSSALNVNIASPAAPIKIDASATTCTNLYFVSIQLADAQWNVYNYEAMKWLDYQDIITYGPMNNFDIKHFAQDRWFSFQQGQYYKVKVAVSPGWHEVSHLIKIN
jgi:hypothetical protein